MPSFVLGTLSTRRSAPPFGSWGTGSVTGTTVNSPSTPVARLVRLHASNNGTLVASTWSDAATGAYAFNYLAAGTYYVVSFDHTGTYGAVIADNLVVT